MLTQIYNICTVNYFSIYRQYVAYKFPELRLLDFRKIKQKEREEANALFKSKKGKELQKEIAKKAKTFVPGGNLPDTAKTTGYNFSYFIYYLVSTLIYICHFFVFYFFQSQLLKKYIKSEKRLKMLLLYQR